jgi:uncharacterized membrane protein YgaE (UPF0421/DUF939 family)
MASRAYSADEFHTRELFELIAKSPDAETKGVLGIARAIAVAVAFIFASIFFYCPGFITFTLAAIVGSITYDVYMIHSNYCDIIEKKAATQKEFNSRLVDRTVLLGPFLIANY